MKSHSDLLALAATAVLLLTSPEASRAQEVRSVGGDGLLDTLDSILLSMRSLESHYERLSTGEVDKIELTEVDSMRLLDKAKEKFDEAKADFYISQVKASLVDPERHGGWPCRSSLLWEPGGAESIFNTLHRRLNAEERPKDFLIITYAIICPSIIVEKENHSIYFQSLGVSDPKEFLYKKAMENQKEWRDFIERRKKEK